MHPSATALFRTYSFASRMLAPLAYRKVNARLAQADVTQPRRRERLGYATQQRPDGALIWFHAASVGESLAAISVMGEMLKHRTDLRFLLTSGTATSAEVAQKRMPPQCQHQFAPLDAPSPVRRFLQHWQPDVGFFVESELWPNMIVQTANTGCHLGLLNARLSAKSVDNWRKHRTTAQYILSHFSVLITQNQTTADNLRSIGAPAERLHAGSNLKALAPAPPVDAAVLKDVRQHLSDRPVWIASSTHDGEEATILTAHQTLLHRYPDLCLILIPRHPERGNAIEQMIQTAGLTCARRTRADIPDPTTQVYLADTLGEIGTWYALSPLVFLGGSLKEIGGHNPFEPAHHGCAIVTGPGYFNFAETYAEMIDLGIAAQVHDAPDLAAQIEQWLRDPTSLKNTCDKSRAFISRQSGLMTQTTELMLAQLPQQRKTCE